uniref:Uncharacterized protein n=1 Tax=Lepeophtheirus salmonis TaxID=72036 RepID=A0A0K2TFP3_LEPSM
MMYYSYQNHNNIRLDHRFRLSYDLECVRERFFVFN